MYVNGSRDIEAVINYCSPSVFFFIFRSRSVPERCPACSWALHLRSHPRFQDLHVVQRVERDFIQIMPWSRYDPAELRNAPAMWNRQIQRSWIRLLPHGSRSHDLPLFPAHLVLFIYSFSSVFDYLNVYVCNSFMYLLIYLCFLIIFVCISLCFI